MDIDSTVFSSPISIVKVESGDDSINDRKEQLRKTYTEGIQEFHNGKYKSIETVMMIHRCKDELNEFQKFMTSREELLLKKEHDEDLLNDSQHRILQTKNTKLSNENKELKAELSIVASKHRILLNEMKNMRDTLSRIIVNLE